MGARYDNELRLDAGGTPERVAIAETFAISFLPCIILSFTSPANAGMLAELCTI